MQPFVIHVLNQGPKFEKLVGIAHNSSHFDTLLVARDLIENQHFSPNIIAQGQKNIQLSIENISFKDWIPNPRKKGRLFESGMIP